VRKGRVNNLIMYSMPSGESESPGWGVMVIAHPVWNQSLKWISAGYSGIWWGRRFVVTKV